MGKGNIDSRDNWQNKAGNAVDKSLAKERLEGRAFISPIQRLKESIAEENRVKPFSEIYPNYGLWELIVLENFSRRSLPLSEINEIMGTKGLAARDWVRSHYDKAILPKEMASILKALFR